jgi:hypothetical protein
MTPREHEILKELRALNEQALKLGAELDAIRKQQRVKEAEKHDTKRGNDER